MQVETSSLTSALPPMHIQLSGKLLFVCFVFLVGVAVVNFSALFFYFLYCLFLWFEYSFV